MDASALAGHVGHLERHEFRSPESGSHAEADDGAISSVGQRATVDRAKDVADNISVSSELLCDRAHTRASDAREDVGVHDAVGQPMRRLLPGATVDPSDYGELACDRGRREACVGQKGEINGDDGRGSRVSAS